MIQCTGIISPFVTSHPVTENILARVKQRTVISLAQTNLTLIVQDCEGKPRHAVSNNKHRASVDARTMLDMELFLSCCYKVDYPSWSWCWCSLIHQPWRRIVARVDSLAGSRQKLDSSHGKQCTASYQWATFAMQGSEHRNLH